MTDTTPAAVPGLYVDTTDGYSVWADTTTPDHVRCVALHGHAIDGPEIPHGRAALLYGPLMPLAPLTPTHDGDTTTPAADAYIRDRVHEHLYAAFEWDGDVVPDTEIDAYTAVVTRAIADTRRRLAAALDGEESAEKELAAARAEIEQLRAKNAGLVRQIVDTTKRDVARISGHALHAAWEALRDAPGGPLIDAMNVITDLAENRRTALTTTTETDQ